MCFMCLLWLLLFFFRSSRTMGFMSLILKIRLAVVVGLALSCFQCQPSDVPKPNPPPARVNTYGYQIVNMWPHDSNAFTQGLILTDGKLLESTGQEGFSSLRRV